MPCQSTTKSSIETIIFLFDWPQLHMQVFHSWHCENQADVDGVGSVLQGNQVLFYLCHIDIARNLLESTSINFHIQIYILG